MTSREQLIRSHEDLMHAIQDESHRFQDLYLWLEKHMPAPFFEEIDQEDVMLVAHNLMAFHLQDFFSEMRLKNKAIVMCIDAADADLRILKRFRAYGTQNYRAFVSNTPPPIKEIECPIRIAVVHFTQLIAPLDQPAGPTFPKESRDRLRALVSERSPDVGDDEFDRLLAGMDHRFLHSLNLDRLVLALDMFFRAKTRDHCQYEVRYNEDWKEKDMPSMQIMLAWRNTPKHEFLYRLVRCIHRHGLIMKKVNASYINPYEPDSILVMALGLHGSNGEAAWDAADLADFLREIATVKYFACFDEIDTTFVATRLIRGNLGNFLRTSVNFIHQVLVNLDPHRYTMDAIHSDLCRHPELTVKICEAFEYKFHPEKVNLNKYRETRDELRDLIDQIDTGHESNDIRRKNILEQGLNLVQYALKTNFYRNNNTAISFRLDPKYLDHVPFDREERFPEIPYAIFFIKGMHFFGFHIRFKDLARGGLRTVFTQQTEQMMVERQNIFNECYNLAYTQQKKNKDIPEGGSKAVIFLKPYARLDSESQIYAKELKQAGLSPEQIERKLSTFGQSQRTEYLYQTQRSFVNSLLTLINCEPDGKLKAKHVLDYWKRPEYVYLGPDENMHNSMIQWIAALSKAYDYKPGGSFISSKPKYGINHKEFGVTSLGVNVYMTEVIKYLGIDPTKEKFTIKMSGGPDGDVAGNQIRNLYKHFRKTAHLVALTDGSGTINDPKGLDLGILHQLFLDGKPIKFYPPEKLHEGGFLLDRTMKREDSAIATLTLCYRKQKSKVVEEWLSGNEMNHLFRNNVHETPADVFIPAGGRPRTLKANNVGDYLDAEGKPTSRAIVEGANLYLTSDARKVLEKKGVIIIKDSSANKAGVICSSFEVLCGLTLGDEEFFKQRDVLIAELLERLQKCALDEACLMLRTHKETGQPLTEISDLISKRINTYTYQLLDHLDPLELPTDPKEPLIQAFLHYCLPTLRKKYQKELLTQIPDHHKKAIISCHIAAQTVYRRGLEWKPSIVDILPGICGETGITG